ncbi:uncharacterized protein LOC119765952 [Culex quinquefasciatus]|uniref:uncharacterized protein LOC119765952 n=1 Tax=Culex quinquefasciatus TaxID=7176 RepID=UPI0018E37564|nr:uncharacterized protein LOC119765952 [Culex quinquefasciatus]
MAPSLRELEKQQSHLRRTLEAIQQFVNQYDATRDADQIDVRLERLDETFNEFRSVRIKIELLTEEDDFDVEVMEGETEEDRAKREADAKKKRKEKNLKVLMEAEDFYCAVKAKLYKKRGPLETVPPVPVPSAVDARPAVGLSHVKLPDINLPIYTGELSEWIVFRDTFRSLIHNNSQLSDFDKFTYLRSSLLGEALLEIAGIDVSAVNYDVAWTTLEQRYDNKKLIVKAHLDALIAVEPMKRESYAALNQLIGSFDKHLMMLKKIGQDTDIWSTLLVHMVCSRLDGNTLRLWETHHKSKDVPKFDDLMKYLRGHCLVLQSVAPSKPTAEEEKQRRPSVSHVVTQSVNKCPFCDELFHSPFHCLLFLKKTVDERMEAARRRNLCLNCLRAGHSTRSCTRGSCHHCHQYHHSLLHINAVRERPSASQALTRPTPEQQQYQQQQPQYQSMGQQQPQIQPPIQNQSSNTAQSNTHSQNTQQLSTTDPCTSHNTTTLSISSHNRKNEILLSTVQICIRDLRGNTRLVRALLDSCSQYSFMSSACCKKLDLRCTPDYLTVLGIGGSSVVSRQLVSANVQPRSSALPQFNREMDFYVLPELTSALPNQNIDTTAWEFPNNIILADPHFNEPGEVELIIGAEHYFDLLRDGRSRIAEDGPVLQNTVVPAPIALEVSWPPQGHPSKPQTVNTTPLSRSSQFLKTSFAARGRNRFIWLQLWPSQAVAVCCSTSCICLFLLRRYKLFIRVAIVRGSSTKALGVALSQSDGLDCRP